MIEKQEKFSFKRKIILSIGLVVAATTLQFAEYKVTKVNAENDVKNKLIKKESIKPEFSNSKKTQILIIDSAYNGVDKKNRNSKSPENHSNTNNRLYESI